LLRIGHAVNKDRKLIPPEPGNRVSGIDGCPQALGDRREQSVAGCVPHTVVHDLEPVEIDE
jgi:hypothetical protein